MIEKYELKKLLEKINETPVESWKKVDNYHRESYYSNLFGNYKVLINRDWEVENGKPEWTGKNIYGFSIVGDPKFSSLTLLSDFRTSKVHEIFQKVSDFYLDKNRKHLEESKKRKRKKLSNLISKL